MWPWLMDIRRRRGGSLATGGECSCGSGRQSQRHFDHRKPRPRPHSSSQKESSIDSGGIRTRYGSLRQQNEIQKKINTERSSGSKAFPNRILWGQYFWSPEGAMWHVRYFLNFQLSPPYNYQAFLCGIHPSPCKEKGVLAFWKRISLFLRTTLLIFRRIWKIYA